jgi:uncharacterized protein
LDVDLEASACTNAVPVKRLCLGISEAACTSGLRAAPTFRVDRLEQVYALLPNDGERSR